MSFTIYTVSDPASVGAALTSMAMFFGQDSWVGSALKTALLVSLLFILAKGVMREGLRLDTMLLQLLVVMVAFLPKTTVTVEQFDNAAPPRVVDGVPYAIAIPGSIAGAFALYMTQKIETVMTGVDGNYISVSGGMGPFTPARILLSYTACASDPMSCMDRNLAETLRLAARYCGGPKLSNANFGTVRSVFNEFSNGLYDDGMTIIYTKEKPYMNGGGGGEAVDCAQAKSYISSLSDTLGTGDASVFKQKMEGLAQGVNIKRYRAIDQADNGTIENWSDTLGKINRVTDDMGKVDTLALANVMSFSVMESLRLNADAPIGQSISIKRDVGLFEWAKSEATQSMLVSSTAPKFMDVLFFVFIAATPIVMFVVAANPASGMKVAGSYILFGIWTQSWIPMLAIITAWYQGEIQNFPPPGAEGATVEYMANMMRHVNTSTIAAANMIQSAPYIMFAIMSGSMMAMSNMIAKAAPSGGAGSGDLTGSAGGGGSAKPGMLGVSPGGGPSGQQQLAALRGGMSALASGDLSNAGSAFMGGNNVEAAMGKGTLGSFTSQGAAQAAQTVADTQAAETTQALSTASKDMMSHIFGIGAQSMNGVSGEKLAQALATAGYTASDVFAHKKGDSATASVADSKTAGTTQRSSLEGKASAGVDLGAIFGAAGSIAKAMAGKTASAVEKGSLGAIQSLANKAAMASSAGDTAGADALGKQLAAAIGGHDAKFPKAGLASAIGGVLGSAVQLQLGATGSLARVNQQGAAVTEEQKGTRSDEVSRAQGVSVTSGKSQTTGVGGKDTAALNNTASEMKALASTVEKAATESIAAKDTQSRVKNASNSAGTGSSTSVDGSTVAQAWGDKQSGKPSNNAVEAGQKVMRALTSALGGQAGAFQSQMEANYARLLTDGKNATMNRDQMMGAAAVQALHSMTQNSDQGIAAAGYKAAAQMAEQSGLGGALNTGAIDQLQQRTQKADAAIQKNQDGMAKHMGDLTYKTQALDKDAQDAFKEDVKKQMDSDGDKAKARLGAAQGANPTAEGTKAGVALISTPEAQSVPGVRDTHRAAERAYNNANDLSTVPTKEDNAGFITGQPREVDQNNPLVKAFNAASETVDGATREGGAAATDVVATAQGASETGSTSTASPVPVQSSLAAGEQVVTTVNNTTSGATSASGGATTALPTLGGGGAGPTTGGGSGGGGAPAATPGAPANASGKPSAGAPSSGQGKPKTPMQGR